MVTWFQSRNASTTHRGTKSRFSNIPSFMLLASELLHAERACALSKNYIVIAHVAKRVLGVLQPHATSCRHLSMRCMPQRGDTMHELSDSTMQTCCPPWTEAERIVCMAVGLSPYLITSTAEGCIARCDAAASRAHLCCR